MDAKEALARFTTTTVTDKKRPQHNLIVDATGMAFTQEALINIQGDAAHQMRQAFFDHDGNAFHAWFKAWTAISHALNLLTHTMPPKYRLEPMHEIAGEDHSDEDETILWLSCWTCNYLRWNGDHLPNHTFIATFFAEHCPRWHIAILTDPPDEVGRLLADLTPDPLVYRAMLEPSDHA